MDKSNLDAQRRIPPDEREVVRGENEAELLRVMRQYPAIYIRPADLPHWRPTLRVSGQISGIDRNLTVLLTDGLQCYFLDDSAGEIFLGHKDWFSGEVKTLFSMQKKHTDKKEKKPRKPKPSLLEQALKALGELNRK